MFRLTNVKFRGVFKSCSAEIRRRLRMLAVVLVGVSVMVAGAASTPSTAQTTTPDLVVLSGSNLATDWELRTDYGSPVSVPTATGVTFTTTSEGAYRVALKYGVTPVSGYSTVELQFGASMANKTFAVAPSVNGATGPGVSGTANAPGFATFPVPSGPLSMLYITGLGSGQTINLQSVRLKGDTPATTTVQPTTTTTAVVGGTGADIAVLNNATVAPGWELRVAWDSPPLVPAANGITFTTTAEGALRAQTATAISGYTIVELQFSASMANKTFSVGRDVTNAVSVTTNSTGYVTATLPTPAAPSTLLYIFGLGTGTVINLQKLTLKPAGSTRACWKLCVSE
jgi:hypothetical protein